MENDEKEVVSTEQTEGSNWGLYFLLLGCLALFIVMIVTAYLDHN